MLCHSKKGKNTTEIQKKICAVCGGGAVTDQTSKVACEISPWMMLHGRVDQS